MEISLIPLHSGNNNAWFQKDLVVWKLGGDVDGESKRDSKVSEGLSSMEMSF